MVPLTIISMVFAIVVFVLYIVLFFKVWGMTNNTKKIVAFLEAQRPDLVWNDALVLGEEEGYFEKTEKD
jgi:uncharacterized membrane protein